MGVWYVRKKVRIKKINTERLFLHELSGGQKQRVALARS